LMKTIFDDCLSCLSQFFLLVYIGWSCLSQFFYWFILVYHEIPCFLLFS
jgi:hypothetical protein